MKTFDLNFFLEKIILREVGHDFSAAPSPRRGWGWEEGFKTASGFNWVFDQTICCSSL